MSIEQSVADSLAAVDLAAAANDLATLARIADALDAQDAQRRARLDRPEALAEAALWYASQGAAVFPLVAGQKRPLVKRGLHEATTDADQVRRWWGKWPQANIGLRTGIAFDVIDVDGPQGYLSLADLRDDNALPPILGRVITPRGTHLYVAPKGVGNKAGLRLGIDYRGVGGYAVAPPSLSSAKGRRWSWVEPIDFAALAAVA
jgi:hypothetical protein